MRLTAYELACGGYEAHKAKNGQTVTLWHEHGTYHVRRGDWRGRADLWVTSSTLAGARKSISKLKAAR